MQAEWLKNEGRNQEGDKFLVWDYVDESGHILATVECPTGDSHEHKCQINIDGSHYNHSYTTASAAMRFCEEAASTYLVLEEEHYRIHVEHLQKSLRRRTAPRWKRLLHLA